MLLPFAFHYHLSCLLNVSSQIRTLILTLLLNSTKCSCSFANPKVLLLKSSTNLGFCCFLWILQPLWAPGHSSTRNNIKNDLFPSSLVIPRRRSHARHPLSLHKCVTAKKRALVSKTISSFPSNNLLYYHFNLQIESLPETEATKKVHPLPSNFILVLPVL